MEIYKYLKNNSEINRRKTLKTFGNIQHISILDRITNFYFVKCTYEKVKIKEDIIEDQMAYVPNLSLKKKEEIQPNSSHYIPLVTNISSENYSVKISNYDLNMKREELYKIISQHTRIKFGRFHMVHDRETGLSKGYSFVSVNNKEEANQLINDLKVVIIDNLRLCVELAKSK